MFFGLLKNALSPVYQVVKPFLNGLIPGQITSAKLSI